MWFFVFISLYQPLITVKEIKQWALPLWYLNLVSIAEPAVCSWSLQPLTTKPKWYWCTPQFNTWHLWREWGYWAWVWSSLVVQDNIQKWRSSTKTWSSDGKMFPWTEILETAWSSQYCSMFTAVIAIFLFPTCNSQCKNVLELIRKTPIENCSFLVTWNIYTRNFYFLLLFFFKYKSLGSKRLKLLKVVCRWAELCLTIPPALLHCQNFSRVALWGGMFPITPCSGSIPGFVPIQPLL